MSSSPFHCQQLLTDVFAPQAGESALILTDIPHGPWKDHADWRERRLMAEEWREAFRELGIDVHPLLTYEATGANNADLPASGEIAGQSTPLATHISESNILVAMTEYSATAPLSRFVSENESLRVASMPSVLRRMEQSALAADYKKVAQRVHVLANLLTEALSAHVLFSTGDEVIFDLRHRRGLSDDGVCTADKKGFRLINLPSGEAFAVPYEGELQNDVSRTSGTIPVQYGNEIVRFSILENRIVDVLGDGKEAARMRDYFDVDPARRNVAELGLGCNDRAVVTGNVLEDEKAGLHWAYGRSEHLGGVTGPDAFLAPENVVHTDIVYAPGSPLGIQELSLEDDKGTTRVIMRDSAYSIF